jgi:hypothetical protein
MFAHVNIAVIVRICVVVATKGNKSEEVVMATNTCTILLDDISLGQ